MNPDVAVAIVELAQAAGHQPPSRSDPESTTQVDDQAVTAFRNLFDGTWLCSVEQGQGHLDEDATAAALEGLLRLTADSRLESQLVGSMGPDGEGVVTVPPSAAEIADAGRLGPILEAASARLARIFNAAGSAGSAAPVPQEGAWTRV